MNYRILLIAVAALPAIAQPPTPKATAPIDLTGYWVSVVTEDWRWRMVTPVKGDYTSVPLNPEGRRTADAWDPAKDEGAGNQCKAYGVGAIMRTPTRLHITWADDNTLKVEADNGTQTRLLHFGGQPPATFKPDWQGYSAAEWDLFRPPLPTVFGLPIDVIGASTAGPPGAGGRPAAPPPPMPPPPPALGGYLKVFTNHLRPGYLRKNGVPYSANAVMTEYFDVPAKESNGDQWLIVRTKVADPQYLVLPFVTSSHFKRLADSTGWSPSPCTAR